MTTVELESLAAERPLNTVEAFTPNDFYGHATWLKRYAQLPPDFMIRAIMPHGPSFCSRLWDLELKHPGATILAISAQQRVLYQQQCPHKTVHVIGSPLLYAARLMADELAAARSCARGTLVFPTHSTHHVTVEFDQQALIASLLALPAELQPVRVCLYWRDVQLGRHREYEAAGLKCVTAGHMFDPEFLPRLLRLLTTSRQVVANKLGSCVYYAAALGLPVRPVPQSSSYHGANPAQLAELSPQLDLPAAVQLAALATAAAPDGVPAQRALARAELGEEGVCTADALRALLESLPPFPSPSPKSNTDRAGKVRPAGRPPGAPAPAAASSRSFMLEATTESLLQQLRPLVAGHPRRAPGRIKLDGRPLAYADLHSLYHQAQQIFGQKLYEFQPASDQPIIIDGGAHIGLASLFFARRFPRATIHAFEADPNIAGLLAANVGAFELHPVHVHGRALWTNNDSVSFDATADDSGHVAARAAGDKPGRTLTVPATRLRDFLAGQPRPVDLLKLDIEGAEFAVVKDCDGGLDRVQNILIEVHRFRDADGRLGELLAVLERNGFDYALGDLHAATWIDSPFTPPFPACKSPHYIVTVFAWRARGVTPAGQPSVPSPAGADRVATSTPAGGPARAPAPVPATVPVVDAVLREAVAHLNARREADALRCFDRAIQHGAGSRSRFGRSVALARLKRRDEAMADLRALLNVEPGHTKARALADELLADHDPARLYIASYPRSGNTWLRLLLADVILQQHGYQTDTTLPIHADYVIPDLHVGQPGDVDRRLRLPCALLKSHDRFDKLAPGRAVCIFRQAADALVSYYHFHRRYPNLAAKAAAGPDAFCLQHVEGWKAHAQSFLDARRRGADILFVSYESLHAESVRVLQAVCRFVGLEAGEDTCRRAVANHAFAKQQAAEKQISGDQYAVPFFRQGEVNGAVRELAPETLAQLRVQTEEIHHAALAAERAGAQPLGANL